MNLEQVIEQLTSLRGLVPGSTEVVIHDHNLDARFDIYDIDTDGNEVVIQA